jgi:hypothetical protein
MKERKSPIFKYGWIKQSERKIMGKERVELKISHSWTQGESYV